MLRIIIILFIAVLILTAFIFPQFRRSLWTTLVVVLCVLAGIIWLDNRQRELQKSRLTLSQIELHHMGAKPGLNARSYIVNGRLQNHSEDLTINMIVLQVTLKDCEAENCQSCWPGGPTNFSSGTSCPIQRFQGEYSVCVRSGCTWDTRMAIYRPGSGCPRMRPVV